MEIKSRRNYEIHKKLVIFIFVAIFFGSFCGSSAFEEVECEIIEKDYWHPFGRIKACRMVETTSIDTPETIIASESDEFMGGLDFTENSKIFFLPISVGETFPNLRAYNAYDCSIQAISKQNFEGLNKLELLFLFNNQITTISKGTFEDLKALEVLDLCKKISIEFQLSIFSFVSF
jgi:Leucine rich repeat